MEQLQYDMDYQIITDFIISEYDRHLNNFGIIRNADTLKWIRKAPAFDSGGCLFANKEIPLTDKALLSFRINGLTEKELTLLNYVVDRKAVDLTKLPPSSFITRTYEKDPQMDKKRISQIAHAYDRKIDICDRWQRGLDPLKKLYSIGYDKKTKQGTTR